jgi:hypothetical protein
MALNREQEAGKAVVMHRIYEHQRTVIAAGFEAKIVMSGKNVCVRETLVNFGMYEDLKNNAYVVYLEEKSRKKKRDKDKDTDEINAVRDARGQEAVQLGKGGFRKNISEIAADAGVDSSGIRNMARLNEGPARALKLVNDCLAADNKEPLKVGPGGRTVGLLDAARKYGLVHLDPYLIHLSHKADGCLNAVKLVNAALAVDNKEPLQVGPGGKTVGLLDAARKYGLVHLDPHLIHLSYQADGCVNAVKLVNAALAADNKEPLQVGPRGRTIGLLDAARKYGLVHLDPYLIHLSYQADGCLNAVKLVNAALAADNKEPLQVGPGGKTVGLLDAARKYGLVHLDPYLIHLSYQADGCVNAVKLVNAALAADNKEPLQVGPRGRTVGLLDAARKYGLVHLDPHLIHLSYQADGCVNAVKLVNAALAKAGESPLQVGRAGQVIGLLEAAKRLGLVGNGLVGIDPYLNQLDHAANDVVAAHNLVNGVLFAAGEAQLHRLDINGPVPGLLEAAKRHNLWKSNAYLNQLYMNSIFSALAAKTRYEEAAAYFANEGLDPALDLSAKIRIVKNIFDRYLRNLRDRSLVQPLFQIFAACKGRADTIQGDEVVAQVNYGHFKAKWNTGVTPFQAVEEFEFFELYKTNNPPNSFLIEKALHQEALNCGSMYPTERLFSKIGAGGFNPAHHFLGKTYGVYLLVRYAGPPTSWVQVKSGVGKKRSRDDSE